MSGQPTHDSFANDKLERIVALLLRIEKKLERLSPNDKWCGYCGRHQDSTKQSCFDCGTSY